MDCTLTWTYRAGTQAASSRSQPHKLWVWDIGHLCCAAIFGPWLDRDCGSNLFLTNDKQGKLQCNPFYMHTHVYTHALTQHEYTQTCRKLTIHYTSILQRSWSQCETCNGARMTILWRFAPDPKHGWLLGLYSAYDNHVHSPFTGAEARHYQSHLSSISPPTRTISVPL